MKDLFKIIFMISLVVVVYIFKDNISNFVTDEILYKGSNKVLTYNEYYIENDFMYVQNIDNNEINNYQDLLNIIYTIINSGDECYSFYCNYDTCIEDVKKLIDDNEIISNINNFVHPYNSFSSINISIMDNGKVTTTIEKIYEEDEITAINEYIESFMNTNINETLTNYDKIKLFHDHIINNTIYDDSNDDKSYDAYSMISTGKGICGAYSDIMSIYLNMLGIKNYRITSTSHVWNLINLDDIWYHLDATWDDPVASDGNQYLLHNFFLISTNELLNLDKVEHNFDGNIYLEAK